MPSNTKHTMNTCTNKINGDSSEQKHIHLSNGLIKIYKIRYTFKIWRSLWIYFVGILHLSIIWWWFAITFCHFSFILKVCCIFKIWIHNVMQFDKRDKAYKAQSHCLMYMLTGLHEVYHPWQLPFHPMIP